MKSSLEHSHAHSEEEEDILEQSNKKVKAEDTQPLEGILHDVEKMGSEPRTLSFKDKLLGSATRHLKEELEDWYQMMSKNSRRKSRTLNACS